MVSGMPPDISVVIVSYKVAELLRPCLASIQREAVGCTYEVIVVENGSGDGSAALVRDEFPDVRLIALDENVGFAAGCNLGARAAEGEYVLLLNPDTELLGDTLSALLRYARAHPRAGLVGGRTLSPEGELDPGSCWGAQSLWSLVCFAAGLSTVFHGSRLFDPESLGGWPRDSERQVDIVTGCLCLVPPRRLGAAGRLRRVVLHVRRGRRPGRARAQARLPPGDHAQGGDPAPRRRVLALRGQARDEPALPRRAGAQALLARERLDRGRAAADRHGRARAGRRRRAPPLVDLARRLAPAQGLARRLRLSQPGRRNGARSISGSRPSTRSAAPAATVGANLKPWPEKPAQITVRSPMRSTIAVSVGVSA